MIKDVAEGLRAFLLADPAISSKVGGSRIHPVKLPNSVPAGPSVVYNLISESSDRLSSGASGLVTSRYQLDSWASSYLEARDLGLLIKDRLNGYRGLMGTGANQVNTQGVFSETANPDYDSGLNLYRISRDFFISYDERV